jgi:chromosome partitioning protein
MAKSRTAAKARASKAISKTTPGPVIIVGNLKGGSGKSTVAFNLALWLAARGLVPDLVDLDPQKTLSDLIAVREEIGAKPRLRPPAASMAPDADGRWTLIDFGAADMERMREIVPHADIVLVPVLPSQADIWATQRYLQSMQGKRKPGSRVALFVNRADPPNVSRETRETMAALKAMAGACEGAVVLSPMLGRRVAFCRSLSEGQGVFELKEKSKASKEFDAFARAVTALR